MNLGAFGELARTRRATRSFLPEPVPEETLHELLDCARWAPSGYNLQPTHFIVMNDPARKEALCRACLNQKQIREAPVTVLFAGDRDVASNHFEDILKLDREAQAIDAAYETLLRKVVPLAFGRGPLGLLALAKRIYVTIAHPFTPLPDVPAANMERWLTRQAMLAAMNFMLAAHAAGLATVPMEGFDPRRVRDVAGLPRRMLVTLVVPVGYAAPGTRSKTRLPLERLVHRNGW